MNRATFSNGVAVAFGLALAASAGFTGLRLLLPIDLLCTMIIAALSSVYVWYLLITSPMKTGRLSAVIGWILCTFVVVIFSPSVTVIFVAQLFSMWLVRALFHHRSTLFALLDLTLAAAGVLAATVTALHSGSVFLSVWVFFLVQALFVRLCGQKSDTRTGSMRDKSDQFDRSRRNAEAAFSRLNASERTS